MGTYAALTYAERLERYGLLEAVSDPEDAGDYADSMARLGAETCQKCGAQPHRAECWTGITCAECLMSVCEDCECGCLSCVARYD